MLWVKKKKKKAGRKSLPFFSMGRMEPLNLYLSLTPAPEQAMSHRVCPQQPFLPLYYTWRAIQGLIHLLLSECLPHAGYWLSSSEQADMVLS